MDGDRRGLTTMPANVSWY